MQAPPPAYPVGQTPAGSNPRTYFTFWSVLFGTLILAWVFSVAASVADVVAASSTTGVPFGDSAYCGSTDREIFGSTVCDLYDAAEGFQFFSTILASVLLVLVFAAASMTAPGTGKLALAAGIGLALFSVVQLIAFSLMLAFVEEPQPGSIGCYKDDGSDRVLTAKWSSDSMTPAICARYCQGEPASYTYYATQYGRECWCQDDSLDRRHGAGTCDYECAGDSGVVCGGWFSFSLYDLTDDTPAPPVDDNYMGCYADDQDDRVLAAMTSSSDMTSEVCAAHCINENSRNMYYATQYGVECWCAVDVNPRHGEGTCDYPCAGDPVVSCGGFNAFDLFELERDGTPTPPVPAAPVDDNYMGCYADDQDDRVLGVMTSSRDMTSEVCAAHCINEDSRNMYYATQYGVECWCAVEVNPRHGEGTCDYPCAGDSAVSCGGFDAFDLFELEREGTPAAPTEDYYVGCFADDQDDRVLDDMISTNDMTLELCEGHCSSMDKPLFALQFGQECWCGGCELLVEGADKYNRHGTASCVGYSCTGERTRQCGAYDAFSLYYRGDCGDTPAPTPGTYTELPDAGYTPSPTMSTSTEQPYATPAPSAVTGGEEEFEGLGIPDDLQQLILEDAAGGFAGPGAVDFSDSSPEPFLASEADSFVVDGVFSRADGEPLDPATVVYLYIFQDTSSGSAAEASRGTAAVDPTTGAFTAAVTDAPAGDSTLVMSFVLSHDGGGGDGGRRLAVATGTGSVYTVSVVNPTECANALAVTLEWDDGASDLDLWVLEPPGGQDVGWTNLNGEFGFLDFDNTVGFGPENYVLTKDLAYAEALFGTYTFRLHGFTVLDAAGDPKTVNYKIVVRKEGAEVIVQEGSITHGQWTADTTVEVEKKYVLAMGGRPLNDPTGGLGGALNHYSLMQWEGLFPCLPEINDVGDLEERAVETFLEEYPTSQPIEGHGIELCATTGYTAWIRDVNNIPLVDDCWEQDSDVWVSRLDFTSTATVVMPVQWDTDGDIWNDVVAKANDYEYAEPPVTGGCALRTHTRWPLTLYQEPEGGLEVLEADLAETENSVYHLVRSNVELAQFLGETPGDEDLQQALEENKLVLVKKRHRIKALRNAISDLRAQRPHLASAASNPNTPGASGGAGGNNDGDAISAMAASMSLNAPPAPSSSGSDDVARGPSRRGSAAVDAPDATALVQSGGQDEAMNQGAAAGAGGGDGRGGVLL
eukprot:g16686.t1